MKCPVCEATEITETARPMPYVYKGHKTVIDSVSGQYCLQCNETILDSKEASRVNSIMLSFNKKINSLIVDSKFIESVRKKLSLGQREAAEIFGGGVNAFSRYENGKTSPPTALIKLFKLLDKHPELLNEIKLKNVQ